jgi:BlaI family transcriptional regulator, penicillinase repressor
MKTLSRRERQILDILYARGRATAADIQAALPDAPGYSATRALLRILEQKGHVRHQTDGPRYVFLPKVSRQRARVDALKHLLQTFFDGSAVDAATALVDGSASKLTSNELDRLEELIRNARKGTEAGKEHHS